ncbi:MAG: hypothetical protein ACOY5B_17325 [Spirochaetota bacterium]
MKKKKLRMVLLLAAATLLSAAAHAAEAIEPPLDPKRKRPGEECKSNDECQRHHKCEVKEDKGVCTAPPPPKLPPGVVT